MASVHAFRLLDASNDLVDRHVVRLLSANHTQSTGHLKYLFHRIIVAAWFNYPSLSKSVFLRLMELCFYLQRAAIILPSKTHPAEDLVVHRELRNRGIR